MRKEGHCMESKSNIRETLLHLELMRRRILRPYFTKLGLTLGQGQPRILDCLLSHENITQKELADTCWLDTTTLSRVLDHMENAGLIRRNQHPDCRRSYQISLTEQGKEKALEVRRGFAAVDEQIWKGFELEEMGQLLALLKRIEKNLQESDLIE